MLLSFLHNEYNYLIRQIHGVMPGLIKIVVIYFDKKADKLKSLYFQKEGSGSDKIEPMLLNVPVELISSLRIIKTAYTWIRQEDIPFETKSTQISKDIFDEVENTVLLIRRQNRFDNQFDLLYLYFRKNPGDIIISRSDKPLSTNNKAIIGTLMVNMISQMIRQKDEDYGLYRTLEGINENIVNQASALKKEIHSLKAGYGESILSLCESYLENYSDKYNRKYVLSEEAREKLKSFNGSIKSLRLIIRNAVSYVNNNETYLLNDEILIREWYLDIESSHNQEEKPISNMNDRHVKTIELLDKLEKAAIRVKYEQRKITGKNVGESFSEPVTAPAITDALKKHKSRIKALFEKYPERWEFIRGNFRPVLNLVDSFKEGKVLNA